MEKQEDQKAKTILKKNNVEDLYSYSTQEQMVLLQG